MNNISNDFNDTYIPFKALLIYNCKKENECNSTEEANSLYVESYDIGANGSPINAHPLSLSESIALAELLQSSAEMQNGFLRSKGMLPANLLYLNPASNGFAVWYTPPQQRALFFVKGLGIPCGKAYVPAMIWKAGRDTLSVFAFKGKSRPSAKTVLYHAPYFNIYANGNVCMGNVHIDIDGSTYLEDFMARWEQYFFASYFSHTIDGGSRSQMNIVQLWQQQVDTEKRFSDALLMKNNLTLNELMQ